MLDLIDSFVFLVIFMLYVISYLLFCLLFYLYAHFHIKELSLEKREGFKTVRLKVSVMYFVALIALTAVTVVFSKNAISGM